MALASRGLEVAQAPRAYVPPSSLVRGSAEVGLQPPGEPRGTPSIHHTSGFLPPAAPRTFSRSFWGPRNSLVKPPASCAGLQTRNIPSLQEAGEAPCKAGGGRGKRRPRGVRLFV